MTRTLTIKEIGLLEQTKSKRALEYYRNRTNLGNIEKADVSLGYTGSCGEKIMLYLKVGDNDLITDVKFQYEGCPGAACCGSALCELIKNKTVEDAKKITQEDIIKHLKASPAENFDCPLLAVKTLERVIEKYKENHVKNNKIERRC